MTIDQFLRALPNLFDSKGNFLLVELINVGSAADIAGAIMLSKGCEHNSTIGCVSLLTHSDDLLVWQN